MTTWLSSDLHLGHVRAIELCNRPWTSTEEMNEALIENHNKVVAPSDMVYYLGDMCMGKLEDTLPLLKRLNGSKMLILGNHDRPSIAYHHKKPEARQKWSERYSEYFPVIRESLTLELLPGQDVLLCHYPYLDLDFKDHEYEGRYEALQPINEGKWLIHGHVHGSWKVKGKQINVGVDVWDYAPVALDTVLNIIKENPDGCSS